MSDVNGAIEDALAAAFGLSKLDSDLTEHRRRFVDKLALSWHVVVYAPPAGVAAGPQTTPQVLWEGPANELVVTNVPDPDGVRTGLGLRSLHALARIDGRRSVRVVAAPTSQEPDDG